MTAEEAAADDTVAAEPDDAAEIDDRPMTTRTRNKRSKTQRRRRAPRSMDVSLTQRGPRQGVSDNIERDQPPVIRVRAAAPVHRSVICRSGSDSLPSLTVSGALGVDAFKLQT